MKQVLKHTSAALLTIAVLTGCGSLSPWQKTPPPQRQTIPAALLEHPAPRSLSGSIDIYLNRMADARTAGTPDGELLESMGDAFKKLGEKADIELIKLFELQRLVK